MRIDEIEARKVEIRNMLDGDTSALDVDALIEEVRSLDAERAEIERKASAEAELRRAVAPEVIAAINENEKKEERNMSENIITRNSPEYIDAFAKYIRSNDDHEVRSLLTENASGMVAVPELVHETIQHAWDNDDVMSLVKKTYVKGNLKVGFERTATDAEIHTEGAAAVTEETLTLGIAHLVPETIMKHISFSAEVLDMDSGSFLTYIYAELTHKIAKKAADELISKIMACTAAGTATTPVVPEITASSIALGTVAAAIAQLSDEANAPAVAMNKLTYAAFKAAQYAGQYPVDPFEGCKVVFNSSITPFGSATTGDVYAIVGDFASGAIANIPNGDISVLLDKTTMATSDMIRAIGRMPVALGVVAPKRFCKIKK